MQDTTSQFNQQKNLDAGFLVRSLLMIDTDSTPLYLSDQPISLNGIDFDPRVLEFSTIKSQLQAGENVQRTGAMSIILSNIPRFDNQIISGKKIRFFVWFDKPFSGGVPITWRNLVNVTDSPLRKTGGVDSVWDAGAFGTREIFFGGISFKAGQVDDSVVCGLSSVDPDQDFDTIEFGMNMQNDGTISAIENGSNVWDTGVTYTINTVLSVEINRNGAIEYKKDGVVQFTSAQTPSFPLFADIAIFNTNASIVSPVLSSGEVYPLKLFVGIIDQAISKDFYQIGFTAPDIGQSFNRVIGNLLELSGFPAADPDNIGMMIPEVYGVVKNHKCLISQVGGVTTLAGDISDTFTGSINVVDVSRFDSGASNNFIIGEEEISYTIRDLGNNQLEGTVVRGVGGTTAASHFIGEAVIEKTTMKVKAANHQSDAISNTRVIPFGHSLKDAVLIQDLISSTSLALSELTIDDPSLVALRVAIAVSQQPDVSLQQKFSGSNEHAHIAAANTTITYFLDSLNGTQVGGVNANLPRWVDKAFASNGSITGYTSFDITVTKQGIEQYDGVVKKIKAKMRCWTTKSGGVSIGMKLYLGGVLKENKTVAVPEGSGSVATFETSFYTAASGYDEWLDFNDDVNNYIQIVSNESIGGSSLFVSEVWWEHEYLPGFETETIQDGTIATTDLTEVKLSGGSVAAFIGGDIIVDIQGREDDGDGTFTGTPNQLIERPGQLIHSLIITHSNGATANDIDIDGSFAETEAGLPPSYNFGFAINNQIELETLLARLAWQCWCRFYWFAGKAHLKRIISRFFNLNNLIATPSPNDLNKNGGSDSVWDAGCFGGQAISSGGISFKAGQTDKAIVFGLSSINTDDDFDTVEFAINMQNDGTFSAIEDGVNVWDTGQTYDTDTLFSIEINPATNAIEYYKDGVLQYTSVAPVTFPLFIDCSFFNTGSSVLDINLTSPIELDTDNDSVLINKRHAVKKINTAGLEQIFNFIELKYNLDYTRGGWSSEDAYQAETEASDATSITDNGIRKRPGGWLAFAIADNDDMVDDLVTKIKDFYKNPRDVIDIPSHIEHVDFEPGDDPEITFSQLGITSKLTQVLGIDYIPPVPIRRKNPQINLSCLDIE